MSVELLEQPAATEQTGPPRACRVCECTDADACMGGCEWAEPDLCSTCAEIILLLADYYDTAGPARRRGEHGAVLFDRAAKEATALLRAETLEIAAEQPLVMITGVRGC